MKKLLLIDGNYWLFSSYYATAAMGNLMTNKDGIPTNAVFGFANRLEACLKQEPDAVLVAFDAKGKTFRSELLEEYKATRKETPEELIVQFGMVREYLDAHHIPRFELEGYEGDDILGTFAAIGEQNGYKVSIMTGDKDMMQLVSDHISVFKRNVRTKTDDEINVETFYEKYQLKPDQMRDLLGLMGDASDNIPGIKGVGEKTALKLLYEYETIENLAQHTDELKGKLGEKIRNGIEDGLKSKKIATILKDVPVTLTLDDLKDWKMKDITKLVEFYQKYDMNSFLRKMDLSTLAENESEIKNEKVEITFEKVHKIDKELLTETTFLWLDYNNELYDDVSVFGLAVTDGKTIQYIDIEDVKKDEALLTYLKEENTKIVYDAKMMYHVLKHQNIEISYLPFDMMIAVFLLDASVTDYDKYLQAYSFINTYHRDDVYGKRGKMKFTADEERYTYVKEQLSHMIEIYDDVKKELTDKEMWELFETIEMPLTYVLYEMEENGVTTDLDVLKEIEKQTEEKIQKLSEQIYDMAGHEFNINSPKQLAVVLFDELGLKANKKRSTAVDVLEKLRRSHPIIDVLMEQRKYQKLYSTYAVGLSKHVKSDGKIHTIFNQNLTATGRLSSSEPNLQNISVRDEDGKEIRKAFVASENCVLLSADYSQIELRMLAHMANEEEMIDAFHHGIDIHTKTAMQIFGVKHDEVTSDMRRQAKTVNFGIVYGQSDFGLSEQLQITRKEAHMFIEKYFESYPSIKTFMDHTIEKCMETGYVTTLFHRRRMIKEINDKNYMVREFGKRAAMNAPIQGSAADLIKLAMVKIFKRMKDENLESKMILQIHDELIFDVKKEELDYMKELVEYEMAHVMELKVPLIAEGLYGSSWYDAK